VIGGVAPHNKYWSYLMPSHSITLPPPSDIRFWSRVDFNGPLWQGSRCWVWNGCRVQGYGRIGRRGKGAKTHRLAYEHYVGPIPSGLTIDHLCRNRPCMNPKHLEPVSGAINTLRGDSSPAKNARKTHCKRGHPFDTDNTYYYPTSGSRACRICKRQLLRAWRRKQ
jgi:hypothetical protein